MKVGILTYHFANNYGAVLQVYALQSILTNIGVETEIIDYQTTVQRSHNNIFETELCLKSIIRNIARLPHYQKRCKRIDKFNSFKSKYLNISAKTIMHKEEISNIISDRYDLIFVGSDQVWNPNAGDFDSIYFCIASLEIPVVSYAASLGNATKDSISQYVEYISKFKFISIREKSGISLLNNLNPLLEYYNTLDPTLLMPVEQYEEISKLGLKINEKYILCYFLGRRNSLKVLSFMNIVSKKLNLKVFYVNVNNGVVSYGFNVLNDAGVEDFISLIKNAAVVFTNSFHATAISLKLGVPFYNFEETGSYDKRKEDLISQFGIRNRSIYDYTFGLDFDLKKDDIIEAQNSLNELSEASYAYVSKCLKLIL